MLFLIENSRDSTSCRITESVFSDFTRVLGVFFCLHTFSATLCFVFNSLFSNLQGKERKGNVLFNDALNTFYLWLYGVKHMVKDNSDSERGNPLPPHRLLFPISSKGSFICTIPQTG